MVVPERCERCRQSISLELDGMLSRFERALLERHLRSCTSCRSFALDVRRQTARLRAAPLVAAPGLAEVVPPRVRTGRRRAVGFVGAVAIAATAALITLTPSAQRRESVSGQTTPNSSLLAVVLEAPTASVPFEVGRLRLVSPASADGAVRGYYGVPA
ncbi:MAG TPA: zf-HC2 domain-containing protein [Gaiellaceae bacterium]|nr:zf-HC2 domain-containing protein [Gaiellaceae bacterium]